MLLSTRDETESVGQACFDNHVTCFDNHVAYFDNHVAYSSQSSYRHRQGIGKLFISLS